MQAHMRVLQVWATGNGNPEQAIRDLVSSALASPVHGSKNAGALREPYFLRYPNLKTYVLVLFRITFLKHIYGIDCRELFFKLFPRREVLALREALLKDDEALAILSTHAVNFLYLFDRMIQSGEPSFNPAYFLDIGGTQYDLTNPIHLQLKIYLYTHCVIGETLFYYRALPPETQAPYTQMLAELETLIDSRFADINLDNKFEFLVCAKIGGFDTKLRARIFDEAARSVSESGTFLVDRHNNNPQTANSTLSKSEHRNVLAIMADRSFTPLTH